MSIATLPEQPADAPPQVELNSRRGDPTWEVARLYPLQGDWTEERYLELRSHFSGSVELSDGCLEFLTMPSPYHQSLMLFLLERLLRHVRLHQLGEVFPAPLGVRLWPGKFREPDLVFLRSEQIVDRHRQPEGADLAIEIVSPRTIDRQRDLETKRVEYAVAGIPEYWIVDPQMQTITVLTLDGVPVGGPYRVHGEFRTGQTAASVLLPGFTAKVDAVFAAGAGVVSAGEIEPADPAQGEPS